MNPRLIERAASMSTTEAAEAIYCDPLTGALNRRGFDELYESGTPLVLLDLDSLKYINDQCGYRSGDRLICIVADKLRTLGDVPGTHVARWGGDEFAVWGPRAYDAVTIAVNDRRLSWGAGECLTSADRALKVTKLGRVIAAERAPRGERPPWFGAWAGV